MYQVYRPIVCEILENYLRNIKMFARVIFTLYGQPYRKRITAQMRNPGCYFLLPDYFSPFLLTTAPTVTTATATTATTTTAIGFMLLAPFFLFVNLLLSIASYAAEPPQSPCPPAKRQSAYQSQFFYSLMFPPILSFQADYLLFRILHRFHHTFCQPMGQF